MQLIYTENELPQRSDEWLEIRKSGIGASETGTILGLLTKYEKPRTLWKRKTGRLKPKPSNAAMLRGSEMEDEAKAVVGDFLQLYEGIENPSFDQYFAKHSKHDFVTASFDGVDLENKFITELKCPSSSVVFKSVFENGIQDYYYPQVQQQLLIANDHWGITKAFFCSYYPDGAYILNYQDYKEELKTLAVIDIDLDLTYCNAMLKVLNKFNDNVKYDHWDDAEYNEILANFKEEICQQ